jgi:ABC-type phosphate transport system ATPase subunit
VENYNICGDNHAYAISKHRMEHKSYETVVKAPETAQTKAACIDAVAKSLSQNGYGQSPGSQDNP